MFRFTVPRDVYHGEGSLEALGRLKGRKAFVCVGESSMERSGFLAKAEEYLENAGMTVQVLSGIESSPSVETVMKGSERMLWFEPDWIVAIGGGSVIDAAKAMWVGYERPGITIGQMREAFSFQELRRKARFCAVPTTSGAASEMTAFSIITDHATRSRYTICGLEMIPDLVIEDPELVMSMPQKLVAHSGMDAFAHAMEAYVSVSASAYTDALALHAMQIIKDNLMASYSDESNEEARANMHDAQCMAGMASSNVSFGIIHSMACATEVAFEDCGARITHGAANAMYLPKIIRYNAKDGSALAKYCFVADFLKLGGGTENAKIVKLVDYFDKLNDALRIPHCISQCGKDGYPSKSGFVPEQVFSERIHDIAANAVADPCASSNPRKTDARIMEKLLSACYYDEEIDF